MSVDRFWRQHLLWPLTLFVAVALVLERSQLDLMVADGLYALEGGQWALKNHFVLSSVLHDAAQNLSRIIGVVFLALAIGSRFSRRLAPYGRGFWLLFAAVAGSAIIVSIIKALSHVDCPWDLLRYGGSRPYLPIFAPHPGEYPEGRCFPSGHAGAGYGLVALYFFFLHYGPRWKWLGLSVGLAMGVIYGVDQQLRGAHFLSHDLWALAICWLVALLCYWIAFHRRT